MSSKFKKICTLFFCIINNTIVDDVTLPTFTAITEVTTTIINIKLKDNSFLSRARSKKWKHRHSPMQQGTTEAQVCKQALRKTL